ncbi:glycoside hydrolase family 104 protein [Chryseobacterium sp. MYb264]|uniref:glycoside hydrolase family 24 protein n=1 Tax=Chryseobacterium sp. MYb264 TaxID=2745153 RepID=UPI002E12F17A|nr:glycoside hydrolase family 104 protein [Chryseobacterium sp. MYb264]
MKLVPKDPLLQVLNGDKSLGEYLNVSNVPKIVDGYFCDAGDTEKLYNSPIDKPLYFKLYAINMVDKKVEIHFMTQSDPYFGFAWSAKQWKDWKDVQDKFSKETFFHKVEGTINKKGELIVKVDPSKLGKPKNYFKIAAVVKITEGEGKEAKEKAAYLEKADLAILYATAKLPDMVENKGAVKVGRETLSKKGENENGVCECEAKVRAYMRMLRVGEGTGELIKSSKYNKETKKNEIVYISNDFEAGYTKLFGGDNFTKSPHNKDMNSHPQIPVYWYTKKNGEKVYSSAAGAYQVMGYNWNDRDMINKRKAYSVIDFSAEGQDKFCVILFEHKRAGMLDLIIKGDIKGATEKYGSFEWASLPPGQYGQPIETMEKALELYNQFYKEELAGRSPLHLKKGFLKEFGKSCCGENSQKLGLEKSLCGKSEIDLRDKIKWQTQFDPKWGARDRQMVACKKTCDDILINNGLKATSLLKLYQTAIEDDKHTKLIINTEISKEAIAYLDSELEKGHPVQVGVDHGIGYKINNNADHSTDHFVVIIGRKCDGEKCYYLFYDVGTSHIEKGASDNNRLYFDKTNYSLKGTTVYNGHLYTVTQIRKN